MDFLAFLAGLGFLVAGLATEVVSRLYRIFGAGAGSGDVLPGKNSSGRSSVNPSLALSLAARSGGSIDSPARARTSST